jgi:hypothetical protein
MHITTTQLFTSYFNIYTTLKVSHLDADLRNKNKIVLQATKNPDNEINNKQLLAPLPKKIKKGVSSGNTSDLLSWDARLEYWSGIWLMFPHFPQPFQTNPITERRISARPLPSTPLLIHFPPVILSFEAIYSGILTALLREPRGNKYIHKLLKKPVLIEPGCKN